MKRIVSLLLAALTVIPFISCTQQEPDIPTPEITFSDKVEADFESISLSCTISGNVTADKLIVEYSKDQTLANAQQETFEKHGEEFKVTISGLEIQTTYYYRYTVENKVSSYKDEKIRQFKTLDYVVPVVTTGEAKNVSGTKATLEGSIDFTCGKEILEKGFFFGIDNKSLEAKPTTEGSLTLSVEGLEFETTYYYQAYAKSKIGIGKGEIKEFKTNNAVSFNPVTIDEVMATSVSVTGGIADNGGIDIEVQGFRYCEGASSSVVFAESTGTKVITDLKPSTTYSIWYYAKTFEGEFESEKVEFETKDGIVVITTASPDNVTTTSALLKASVISDGGSAILERGFCYGRNDNPTVSDIKLKIIGTLGEYDYHLTSLPQNTKYYVRAYATNAIGTYYGDSVAFTTLYDSVVFGTMSCSNVTASTASLKGSITSNGGSTITKCGFCYSTSANPTVNDQHLEVTGSTTNLTATIKGLKNGVKYFARTFAINANSTFYSNEITFETTNGVAVVTTLPATNVRALTATLNGEVVNDGGSTISERGFCYSTSPNPTTSNNPIVISGTIGTITKDITNLIKDTKYYVRVYATNGYGTYYGNEVSFTTSDGNATFNNLTSSETTVSSFRVATAITSDGDNSITKRGFCYSTKTSPTVSDQSVTVSGTTGEMSATITGLTNNTTYYVRAFATNGTGTSYSSEISVSTLSGIAEVETTALNSITAQSVEVSGNVVTANGGSISSRGFCYSTNENPTINNTKVTVGGTTGSMSKTITGLTVDTKYYIRAFATTSYGTSYGDVLSFTTEDGAIAFSVVSASNILAGSAKVAVTINSTGGTTITERGFCYSTADSPTVSDNKVVDNGSNVYYSKTIDNLQCSTQYFIRAYASNSIRTYYSDILSISIPSGIASLSSLSVTNVESTSAFVASSVTNNGGADITQRGFCYSTVSAPTTSSSIIIVNGTTGQMSTTLQGLSSDSDYYIRAFATTKYGTSYSNEVSIHTKVDKASFGSTWVDNILPQSVVCHSTLEYIGDLNVSEMGFCYNTSSSPTEVNSKVVASKVELGDFSLPITSLEQYTTYYVRPYAISKYGASFGEEISFTTTYNPIVFGNTLVNKIYIKGAMISGSIISNGGIEINEKGFCLSTSTSPSDSDAHFPINSNEDSFESTVKGLKPNTTYYAFCYAKNRIGTFYSDYASFRTLKIPDGAAPGLFRISDDSSKLIYISKGNLEKNNDTGVWHFAESQYKKTQGYSNSFEWIADGSSKSQASWHNTSSCDWGKNAIDNGGNQQNSWKTPSLSEWSGILKYNISAEITIDDDISGIIVLPYDWVTPGELSQCISTDSFVVTSFSKDQWSLLEDAGAVLLSGPDLSLKYGPLGSNKWQGTKNGLLYWTSETTYESVWHKIDNWYCDYYPTAYSPYEEKSYLGDGTYPLYVRLIQIKNL